MRKTVLITLLLAAVAGRIFSATQFRMGMDFAANVDTSFLSIDDLQQAFEAKQDIFYGGHWEVMLNRFGFGMQGFTNLLVDENSSVNLLDSVSWDGSIYLSFHFFGGGFFLDPFVRFGFGCIGKVATKTGSDLVDPKFGPATWGQIDIPSYHYYSFEPFVEGLALYPLAAAGVSLDLDGLLLGASVTFHPFPIAIPTLDVYSLTNFKFVFFGGIAFGGHR